MVIITDKHRHRFSWAALDGLRQPLGALDAGDGSIRFSLASLGRLMYYEILSTQNSQWVKSVRILVLGSLAEKWSRYNKLVRVDVAFQACEQGEHDADPRRLPPHRACHSADLKIGTLDSSG